jgi:hypothetical protein
MTNDIDESRSESKDSSNISCSDKNKLQRKFIFSSAELYFGYTGVGVERFFLIQLMHRRGKIFGRRHAPNASD